MRKDFLAVTLIVLTKSDISAIYQQAILDNLAEIWYVLQAVQSYHLALNSKYS